jgi:hypothetical protein
MQDGVKVARNVDEGRHICTHQSEPVALQKVFHITGIASREIVETDDFVDLIQETITEVRSEKSSPSGHRSTSTLHLSPTPRTKSDDRPPIHTRSLGKDVLLGHPVQPASTIARR